MNEQMNNMLFSGNRPFICYLGTPSYNIGNGLL